jgi:RepB DNA-primase from phage plasmid/CHC2 zinc finger
MGGEIDGSEIEVRSLRDGAERQRFFAPDDPLLPTYVRSQSREWNVYFGRAPRRVVYRIDTHKRYGGKGAIERVWQLWSDLDGDEALERALDYQRRPSLIVASGSPNHYHAYWRLRNALPAALAERFLPRLAYALGADMRSTDVARILRAAGTLNHKSDPPAPVECVSQLGGIYHAVEIILGLDDPPVAERHRPIAHARSSRSHADDALRSIPASEYVPTLIGHEPDRRGKIACPFHEDRNASLHVYPDGGGWYCFGCERGGTIIDFAAALWGVDPRGRGYQELRRRLREVFR